MGEWWCPDKDRQDISRYHNVATLADVLHGPPPDSRKKESSRTNLPISREKVEERNDDVGATELGIAKLSLSSSSSGPAGGEAVQPSSAGPLRRVFADAMAMLVCDDHSPPAPDRVEVKII